MKNKRFLVIGVTLILLALVGGAAFAQSSLADRTLNGVIWIHVQGRSNLLGPSQPGDYHTQITNMNDYPVRVNITLNGYVAFRDMDFAAKETKHFGGRVTVSRVVRR